MHDACRDYLLSNKKKKPDCTGGDPIADDTA